MHSSSRAPDLEQFILQHLDDALARGHIQVYVQPVIRTVSRQVCGMEALARWIDPERGLLMPNQFIPVLEKHRRIHELDAFIIRRVCDGYSRQHNRVFVPVSVNLSRLDYELCDIFEVVESAVRDNRMPRSSLCIEITESVLANNEALMRQYIERFRNAGYAVWMDDFGSGYSSLNVLKDYAFDELKIDMRFLSDFHPRSRQILAAIVHMAKQIDIQTLAEGVETEEQFEFLRNIGCEKVQGFLFGQPMPYPQCLRHVAALGLEWEAPGMRRYYDDIGHLNVLSATPFQSDAEKAAPADGRDMNSIPLAVIELRDDRAEVLYSNQAFDTTAPAVDWTLLKEQATTLEGIPLSRVSRRLAQLLEEARADGTAKLFTVYNGDYYEMRARRISAHGDICAVLMGVTNLSQIAALDNQQKLDEGLRSLYSVYEQVSLLDLNNMTVIPLYLNSQLDHAAPMGNLTARMREYAVRHIFPEDQERFLSFTRADTLEQRVAKAGGNSIAIHLRTLQFHGAYAWKGYQLVRIRENTYYLLVRDAQGEIREFQSAYQTPIPSDTAVTPELLWENVVAHSTLKFFWKDAERRFLGASRSFLDHYDFKSIREIIGKTDEDMGWHIHPDQYRDEELKVLREGIVSRQVVGTCLVQGENHNIIASKMPIYNRQGEITGLIGHFYDAQSGPDDQRGFLQARMDDLTGLLNSRGIYEDLYAYIDEYQLRSKDFARIEVAIDNFAAVNDRYGYDFGDAVIREAGRALLKCFGNTATVGRTVGCYFTVLVQFNDPAELDGLVQRIRRIPAMLKTVNGIPFSMYLSVGVARYSESESKDSMATQAELRRMTDDVESISRQQLMENTGHIFQMYDDLPLAYAVYKVLTRPKGIEALVLYANRECLRLTERTPEALIGRKVREVSPWRDESWFNLAAEAALKGQRNAARFHSDLLNREIAVTAHPIIGPGFCAFSYQPISE